VDDIADDEVGARDERRAALAGWSADIASLYAGRDPGRAAYLADAVQRFGLAQADFEAVIAGMAMDVDGDIRWPDWATLDLYCDRVASAVGRLSVRVFGMDAEPGQALAHHLGRALQLTNILRDVGEDAHQRGRIYLPLEDLECFSVSEEDILHGQLNGDMIRLLQFEIERAHHLYEEAWPGIGFLAEKARFSVAVASDVYRGILGKIIANQYDVFNKRAFLTKSEKLRRIPGIWVRTQRLATPESP